MGQEEQKSGSSNGGGGGGGGINAWNICGSSSSGRKQKLKKFPQRGLGVAQLEKMRIEEQQKKINLPSPPPPPTPTSPTKPSIINLSVPIFPNHHQSCNSSSSSIPYPPHLSSLNSTFNPQNTDLINSNTVPLANSVGWQSESAAVQGHRNVPKINDYNYNIDLEKEINFGVDPGLAFRSCFNLPYESNPIWPLPSLMKRAQHHQKGSTPPAASASASFSSMVNVLSGSSSSSSLNFHMEPPSNQSYYDNYTCNTPFCVEEEKMAGMKRPYPFSIDNIPPAAAGPVFHNKCPPALYPISRSDHDSASFGYNFMSFNNSNCRETSTCSTSILEPYPKKNIKGNGACNGDFLTLALPTTTSSATLTSPTFKFEHPSANVAFHNYESFDFDSLPYQGNVDDPVFQAGPNVVPNRQQPYHCFLPPAIMQIGQPTSALVNCNGGEVGENIDLNLKL